MHLKKIKLAGFKSFVDPTTVTFPSQLTAVVGPNGCGKSNIIDAIRWVMGESSAKYLRGESLPDVIFNGSAQRKPVGQALVELMFDNNAGKIGGEYAQYSEIAVKRIVDRDSQSTYFLNGTRCRRKDINDIFLGTGLGPRSYSIIGQGTISRFVEASPEDLRGFIEEAAKISRYKERRRETERRMRDTQENLTRVDDILAELQQQLQRLQKQAKNAERYQQLRSEEQRLQQQLLGMRWQKLTEQAQQKQQLILQQEVALQERVAADQAVATQLEQNNLQQTELKTVVERYQQIYYQTQQEITRLQETVQHQQQQQQQTQAMLQRNTQELTTMQAQYQTEATQLAELTAAIDQLQHTVQQTQQASEQAEQQFTVVEQVRQDWQQRWDEQAQVAADAAKQAHGEQARIQQLEQRIIDSQRRVDELRKENNQATTQQLTQQVTEIDQRHQQLLANKTRVGQRLEQVTSQLTQQRTTVQQVTHQLGQCKTQLHDAQGKHAALQMVQQTALGATENPAQTWLQQHDLLTQPRLAHCLHVNSGWEIAVETVLGERLQAVCVTQLSDLYAALATFEQGTLTLLAQQAKQQPEQATIYPTLLSEIQCDVSAVCGLLHGVYVAETVTDALDLLPKLTRNESVVTRDGIWLSATQAYIKRTNEVGGGVIQREAQLRQLTEQVQQVTERCQQLTEQVTQAQHVVQQYEQQREQCQHDVADAHQQLSQCQAELQVRRDQLEQWQQRVTTLTTELSEQEQRCQQQQRELAEAREVWAQALQTMEQSAQVKKQLQQEKITVEQQWSAVKQEVQQCQSKVQHHTLDLRTKTVQLQEIQKNRQRETERIEQLRTQCNTLEQELAVLLRNEDDLPEQLQQKLKQSLGQKDQWQQAKQAADELVVCVHDLSQQRQQIQQACQNIRLELEQLRMQQQEYSVRATTLTEGLQAVNVQQIIVELPDEANETQWEQSVQQAQRRIERLGSINLAAIEEHRAAEERHNYLHAQRTDLQEALDLLEQAMGKIDQETRQRFQQTYAQINQNFTELFPRLFGGGKATLELTEKNLLNAGVQIMAQPPGKKNNSLHALSGGEKALTAVALVFAIFQLNPAPFCLLDEVDAPLDDANVGRFCQLVKEMSAQVQFIIITHNKITMELANHLIGVTMREPGVSRIVSVDMERALTLVEQKTEEVSA